MSTQGELFQRKVTVTVDGQPRSKARPRFTGSGKVYSDKVQRAHEQALGWAFRAAVKPPFAGGVAVEIIFFRSDKQRIDLDNLIKAVLDAANGICWRDDVQVVRLAAQLELDRVRPRTIVTFRDEATSMPRGEESDETTPCLTCGSAITFRRYVSVPDAPKFCSQSCRQRQPRGCPECGSEFRPSGHMQRFCGKDCAAAAKETRRQIAVAAAKRARPPNNCRNCGVRLARRTAILCRTCWLSPVGKNARVLHGYPEKEVA